MIRNVVFLMRPIAFLTFSLLSPSFGFVQLRLVVNFDISTLLTEFCSWHGFFENFSRLHFFGRSKQTLLANVSDVKDITSRDLSRLLRRRQGERRKSYSFNEKINNSARTSPFFVHFFAIPARLRSEMTTF